MAATDASRATSRRGERPDAVHHPLAEVAQTVDDVVIIASGRLVRQAKLSELAPDGRELEDLFLSLTEAT